MKSLRVASLSVLAGFALAGATLQTPHAQTKPPAYAVVEIDITDADGFTKEFQPVGNRIITAAGGRFLARGGKTVSIDGEPPKVRALVAAFESVEKAQAAFASAEYREARKTGDKYAKFRIWIVEGLPQ